MWASLARLKGFMNLIEPIAGKAKPGFGGWTTSCRAVFAWTRVSGGGAPGTGKTTIALQFLMEGAQAGEKCLYITLSETERELRDGAASHGWDLDDRTEIFELLPPESLLDSEQQQSCFILRISNLARPPSRFSKPWNARGRAGGAGQPLRDQAAGASSLRYRRQILAIKHYFAKFGTTVMLLDDLTAELADKTVHSVAHGVLRLEELAPAYGAERRRAAS